MEAVDSAIFQEVAWRGPLTLEELLDKLPAYGWNRIFAAIDRLSRDNRLSLGPPGRFVHASSVPRSVTK